MDPQKRAKSSHQCPSPCLGTAALVPTHNLLKFAPPPVLCVFVKFAGLWFAAPPGCLGVFRLAFPFVFFFLRNVQVGHPPVQCEKIILSFAVCRQGGGEVFIDLITGMFVFIFNVVFIFHFSFHPCSGLQHRCQALPSIDHPIAQSSAAGSPGPRLPPWKPSASRTTTPAAPSCCS